MEIALTLHTITAMFCNAIAIPVQCCWENWGRQRECEGILGPASHTNNDDSASHTNNDDDDAASNTNNDDNDDASHTNNDDSADGDDDDEGWLETHTNSFCDIDEVSDGEMFTCEKNE